MVVLQLKSKSALGHLPEHSYDHQNTNLGTQVQKKTAPPLQHLLSSAVTAQRAAPLHTLRTGSGFVYFPLLSFAAGELLRTFFPLLSLAITRLMTSLLSLRRHHELYSPPPIWNKVCLDQGCQSVTLCHVRIWAHPVFITLQAGNQNQGQSQPQRQNALFFWNQPSLWSPQKSNTLETPSYPRKLRTVSSFSGVLKTEVLKINYKWCLEIKWKRKKSCTVYGVQPTAESESQLTMYHQRPSWLFLLSPPPFSPPIFLKRLKR